MTWVMLLYCGLILASILLSALGERAKPGRVGRIVLRQRRPARVRDLRPLAVLGRLGLGLLCLAACAWLFRASWLHASAERFVLTLGLFVTYLAASNVVQVEPDWTNVGYAMGAIGDPTRLSDDYNRWLRLLQVGLIPGRLITDGISDAVVWALAPRGPDDPPDSA